MRSLLVLLCVATGGTALADMTFAGKDGVIWTVTRDPRVGHGTQTSRKVHVWRAGTEVATFEESSSSQSNPKKRTSVSYTFALEGEKALVAREIRKEWTSTPIRETTVTTTTVFSWDGAGFVPRTTTTTESETQI
jgi:hypothetical protein